MEEALWVQDELNFEARPNAGEPIRDSLDGIIQRNDKIAHYWLHQIVDLVNEQPEQPRLD